MGAAPIASLGHPRRPLDFNRPHFLPLTLNERHNMTITDNTNAQDFAKFVDLQQQFTEKHNKLQELEVTINRSAQAAAESSAAAYVILQEELSRFDAELKAIFEKHPEWRGDKKSVDTPYGNVQQRTVIELEVPNPAMTVALIKARGQADKEFAAADFLRVEEEPNLEALERLDDAALSKLGVNRNKRESITVKPAKVNVAKAVKAAKKPAVKEAV
jgi:Bacteriophage Mu Gam like protein